MLVLRILHKQIVSYGTNTIGIKSVSIAFGMIVIFKRVDDVKEKLGISASLIYILCGSDRLEVGILQLWYLHHDQ